MSRREPGRRPVRRAIGRLLLAGPFLALAALSCGGGDKRPAGLGDGGGAASIDPFAPATVGRRGTWAVRYVAGPEGIGEGGGVVVHFPLFWEWSEPQLTSPGYAGYTTVTASSRTARIEADANSPLHYVRAIVAEGTLAEGETLLFVYGDTTAGNSRAALARADSYAGRGEEFLVKVDGDGDGFYAEIGRSPVIDVLAGPAAALRIHLKGEAAFGETTLVAVTAVDRFGNRAALYGGTIRFSHKWNVLGTPASYAFRPEDEGTHAFPVQFTAPGYQTIGVVEEGGTFHATSNPILVRIARKPGAYRLLWGDLHMHSHLSDGTGLPEDLYRYARQVANLDVAAVTDHDHHGLRPLDGAPWEEIRRAAEESYRPGSFVTLLAYEWTNWEYGHRNVYYRDGDGSLFSTADSSTNDPVELWRALPAGRAMTIAHHVGGGPVPTDWSIRPPDPFERLVEISSIHGTSECRGCPKEIYSPVPGSFVRDALARGYRLGFLGSGDGHAGHPGETETPCGGLAGIWATGRSREAVWEALTARRTYATSGERILLEVRLDDHWMGEEIDADRLTDSLRFHVSACGTAPIDLVELIAGGVPADTLLGTGPTVEGSLEAPLNRENATYYYVRLAQMDGGLAWSSPIWIDP